MPKYNFIEYYEEDGILNIDKAHDALMSDIGKRWPQQKRMALAFIIAEAIALEQEADNIVDGFLKEMSCG